MEADVKEGSQTYSPAEYVYAYHHEDFLVRNPGWDDIPNLPDEIHNEIRDQVPKIVPGTLDNAARKRNAIIQTLGCQYVRYRRARCSKSRSYKEALRRSKFQHDLSDSAVHQHISSLPVEAPDELLKLLERLTDEYYTNASNISSTLIKPCDKLVKVVSVIADVDHVPELNISEISLADVKSDQCDNFEPIINPGIYRGEEPPEIHRNSAVGVTGLKALQADELLDYSSMDKPIYLSEDATVRTRDITNYNTNFSGVYGNIVEAIKSEMKLRGKQKPNPTLSKRGDDNVAVRAIIPFPEPVNKSNVPFTRIEVSIWESGASNVSIRTRPLGHIHDINDPCQSGPVETISMQGLHALIGQTMDIVGWYKTQGDNNDW